MITPVRGFLSRDGAFFLKGEEAELHDAEQLLIGSAFVINIDPDRLLGVVHVLHKEIERYIAACRHSAEAGGERRLTTYAHDRIGKHDGGEEDAQAEFEFEADGDRDVSDMGSRELAASMALEGEGDGVGSGRGDASGVRGSEDLATGARPRTTQARPGDSEQVVWSEAVAEVSRRVQRRSEDGGV